MILRVRLEAVGLEQGQHLDQRLGAHLGQMLGQLAARLVGVDVVRDLQENRTRIQASSIRMIVTPVCSRPFTIAHSTARPRAAREGGRGEG